MYAPTLRFKRFLSEVFLLPVIPHHGNFSTFLPIKGTLEMPFQSALGLHTLLYGLFEKRELSFVCGCAKKGDTVIDIGANIGLYTVTLAHAIGPDGRVFAIEPVKKNCESLKKNIENNHLSNTTIFPIAIGEQNGETKIHLPSDLAFASVVTSTKEAAENDTVTVPLKTLDSIWEETGEKKIKLIKIDVEGAELSVLKGATKLLQKNKPLLLIEAATENKREEINQYLSQFGYTQSQPHGFSSWNYIFQHTS